MSSVGELQSAVRSIDAIFGCNLNRVLQALPFVVAGVCRLESNRCVRKVLRFVHLDPHHGMRTDHGTLAALDTCFRVPHRNFERDVAFLQFTRGGWISAVGGKSAHGNLVSMAGINSLENDGALLGVFPDCCKRCKDGSFSARERALDIERKHVANLEELLNLGIRGKAGTRQMMNYKEEDGGGRDGKACNVTFAIHC